MAHDPALQFVDLERQYLSIKEEIDSARSELSRRRSTSSGMSSSRFEEEFASYCKVEHCVGVGSGAAAIQLALESLGIAAGDEVIAPANTFFGSVLPVLRLAATPILVDCDEETATIDPERVAAAVGPRTKAVIAVHLYGQPVDVDPLQELCDGERHRPRRGRVPGARSALQRPADRRAWQDRCLQLLSLEEPRRLRRRRGGHDRRRGARRAHSCPPQCRSDRSLHARRGRDERATGHDSGSSATSQAPAPRPLERASTQPHAHLPGGPVGSGGESAASAPWAEHVWHLYVVRSARRDEVRDALDGRRIGPGMHYPLPLHLQPALRHLGHSPGDFPVTEAWARELLSLPMFPELARTEIERVADTIAPVEPAKPTSKRQPVGQLLPSRHGGRTETCF